MRRTTLSVNINKIALIRNSRGHNAPDILQFSRDLLAAGAEGITVHPRPDERHIRRRDVYDLKQLLGETVELNVEGYPSPDFLAMIRAVRPAQCTLVPDEPGQLTSDHGWDCQRHAAFLADIAADLKSHGVRCSIFLDPDPAQVPFAAATGTDRIELYTQAYAEAYGTPRQQAVTDLYRATYDAALALGLGVNAGHDLTQHNLRHLVQQLPGLLEVSIGHHLICEMLYQGLPTTIRSYRDCLR